MTAHVRSSRPNRLMRVLLIASALAHLVALLYLNGWAPSSVERRIEVALASRQIPSRAMPRPRARPPQPPPDADVMKQQTPSLAPPMALPELTRAAIDAPGAPEVAIGAESVDASQGRFGLPALLADAGAAAEDRDLYFDMVRQRIERHKKYPLAARKRQIQGRVVVQFTLSETGDLHNAQVIQSSRSADLDRAALEAVRSAAPFPRPPSGVVQTELALEVAIFFELS